MAGMGITALVTQPSLGWALSAFMCGLVFMMGASTMYFLGRQAALDATVRGFALVGKVAGLAGSAVGISGEPMKPKKDPK